VAGHRAVDLLPGASGKPLKPRLPRLITNVSFGDDKPEGTLAFVPGFVLIILFGVKKLFGNMNTTSKTKRFGYSLYGIAAVLVLLGVVLDISGSVRVGTFLIAFSIVFAVSAALRLGHIKRW
jgi:hypothetical protein